MTRVIPFPDHGAVKQEAAAWIAKLDSGALSRDDLRALRAWAAQHRSHRLALDELAASWDMLDVLALTRPAAALWSARSRRRRFVGKAALAAGMAAVALIATFVWGPLSGPETAKMAYFTGIGEQLSVRLPDRSIVRLNTNSRLQVDYSRTRRDIVVLQGEAFFEVEKSTRPFVVTAGRGTVAAVGTAFAVRVVDDNVVEVGVLEGSVVVDSVADAAQRAGAVPRNDAGRVVNAGGLAHIGETIDIVNDVEPMVLERHLAWRDGMLIFDGDTLDGVIAEVSRYTPAEIVIADPALRDVRISGYFRTGDTDLLLRTLASNFQVDVDHIRPGLIYLRSTPSRAN